eukprot:TRINITY_DN8947_c0_g1_i4.p1 TRINITY_DN8947_c0_g1~~TRINITY_DN8947_c0_g1_i4.p1  ORF type:complete len:344 (+),score=15.59 TRINITY_DN8947_c0_g1_i4:64-1095(+)
MCIRDSTTDTFLGIRRSHQTEHLSAQISMQTEETKREDTMRARVYPPQQHRTTSSPQFRTDRLTEIKTIGRGGFGVVQEALDMYSGRRVALKSFQKPEYFDTEATMMEKVARCGSKHLIKYYGIGTFEERDVIVTEAAVCSLRTFMRARDKSRVGVSILDLLEICRQLMIALEDLQKASIMHGDVKPENAVLFDDGTVKLIDLGLAQTVQLDDAGFGMVRRGQGTADYIAPELVDDGSTINRNAKLNSFACDLFGLGKLLQSMGRTMRRREDWNTPDGVLLSEIIVKLVSTNPLERRSARPLVSQLRERKISVNHDDLAHIREIQATLVAQRGERGQEHFLIQ